MLAKEMQSFNANTLEGQSVFVAELQNFLTELQKEINDIAELPAPSENSILSIISKCRLKEWSLAPQEAGIVWSVGRFARECSPATCALLVIFALHTLDKPTKIFKIH